MKEDEGLGSLVGSSLSENLRTQGEIFRAEGSPRDKVYD